MVPLKYKVPELLPSQTVALPFKVPGIDGGSTIVVSLG